MTQVDLQTVKGKVNSVGETFRADKEAVLKEPTPQAIEDLRLKFLGRKGLVTALNESMRHVAKEDRPELGKIINSIRQEVETSIESLKAEAEKFQLQQKLQETKIDVSLPTSQGRQGSLHPVTLMRRVLLQEFRRLGFTVYDGPEVDLDLYNFSKLNFQDDHPARDMQDTFFVKDYERSVLRTHTSNIQIHAMLNEKPPMRVVAPGRTYRCDSDLTHTPMFHQIEGFVVDQNISMGDMKGVIDAFLKAIFGADLDTRLRLASFHSLSRAERLTFSVCVLSRKRMPDL